MTLPASDQSDWKPRLRRKIAWLLVVKAAALVLLWALFFSPEHRPAIDAGTVAGHLAPAADSGNTHKESE